MSELLTGILEQIDPLFDSEWRLHPSSLAGISLWLPLWVISGVLFGKAIERYAQPVVVIIFLAFCVAAYLYSKSLGKRILGHGGGTGALLATQKSPGDQ